MERLTLILPIFLSRDCCMKGTQSGFDLSPEKHPSHEKHLSPEKHASTEKHLSPRNIWVPIILVRKNIPKRSGSTKFFIDITVKCRFSKKMDRPKPLAKLEKFAKTEELANFKNHEILHLIFENFQMFSTHQIEVCTYLEVRPIFWAYKPIIN